MTESLTPGTTLRCIPVEIYSAKAQGVVNSLTLIDTPGQFIPTSIVATASLRLADARSLQPKKTGMLTCSMRHAYTWLAGRSYRSCVFCSCSSTASIQYRVRQSDPAGRLGCHRAYCRRFPDGQSFRCRGCRSARHRKRTSGRDPQAVRFFRARVICPRLTICTQAYWWLAAPADLPVN